MKGVRSGSEGESLVAQSGKGSGRKSGGAGSGPGRKWHVRHGDRGENQPPENGARRETGSGG